LVKLDRFEEAVSSYTAAAVAATRTHGAEHALAVEARAAAEECKAKQAAA